MVTLKKALCLLLAITFICSVVVYGRNQRFSLQKMIENITNFQDVPTIEDLVRVWQEDGYFDETAYQLPYWVDVYTYILPKEELPSDWTDDQLIHYGYVPLAYNKDYTILDGFQEGVDYWYIWCYDANGQPIEFMWNGYPDYPSLAIPINNLPVTMGLYHTYESYHGENEVLEFFDNIKGFFLKLGSTISLACEMFLSIFDNLQYLLPWKNTVPKEG